MTDLCCFRVLGNDDSIIGKFFVDLEKQLTQISAGVKNKRNCVKIIEDAFVFFKSELPLESSLCGFNAKLRWIFWELLVLGGSIAVGASTSHHRRPKHSAIPTPAKSGLPIKAALAVAKKSKEIVESSKFRFFSKPDSSSFPLIARLGEK